MTRQEAQLSQGSTLPYYRENLQTIDLQLRQRALEQAIQHFGGQGPEKVVEVAQTYYDFLKKGLMPDPNGPIPGPELVQAHQEHARQQASNGRRTG